MGQTHSTPRTGIKFPIFLRNLSKKDQRWISDQLAELPEIDFAKAEKIIHEGMPALGLYLICEGHIKVSQSGQVDKKRIIKIVGPGELLGEESVLSDGVCAYLAETVTPARARFLSQDQFQAMIQRCPMILNNLNQKMALEVKAMQEKLLETSFSDCKEKVARVVMTLARAFGKPNEQGQLQVDWTRRNLAEMAGVSVEMTTRTLHAFEQNGWAKTYNNTITILSEKSLALLSKSLGVKVLESVF